MSGVRDEEAVTNFVCEHRRRLREHRGRDRRGFEIDVDWRAVDQIRGVEVGDEVLNGRLKCVIDALTRTAANDAAVGVDQD